MGEGVTDMTPVCDYAIIQIHKTDLVEFAGVFSKDAVESVLSGIYLNR